MKRYQQVGMAWQAAWPHELLILVPPEDPLDQGIMLDEENTRAAARLDAWCSTALGTAGSWRIYTTWDPHVVMLGTQHAEHLLMARLAWGGI
jgi:hypothetical protein